MAGNPVQGGAQVIAQQSGGRKTALALILGIAFAEMVLSGKLGSVWSALWGPTKPLKGSAGQSVGQTIAGSSGGSGQK